MDFQKERESFDEWHYNQYLLENPNIDISNAKYIYDYAHKNELVYQLKESHFLAWQAAKAQAVPDGFVLVPKEPTQEMLIAGRDMVTFGCGYDDVYKAMIEAQEQANDI